jgi:hypothetical protein
MRIVAGDAEGDVGGAGGVGVHFGGPDMAIVLPVEGPAAVAFAIRSAWR